MKSPWKRYETPDPGSTCLVLASSIPARRVGAAGKMFRGSRQVRKQLASAEGLVGFSLLARPFKKQYATLSVWRDQAALDAFVAANPHHELMQSLRPEMGETRFITWEASAADARPSWKDALERLAAPA